MYEKVFDFFRFQAEYLEQSKEVNYNPKEVNCSHRVNCKQKNFNIFLICQDLDDAV